MRKIPLTFQPADPDKLFPVTKKSVLSWQFGATIVLAICLIIAVYQIYFEKVSDMVLAYVLYPASISILALLVYTKKILKHAEVKVMGAFLFWVIIVLFLNDYRVSNALTSTWFYCTCVTSFICFGLPYSFSNKDIIELVRIISAVTVLAATILCTIGLISVFTGWIPPIAIIKQGQFGIMDDGRLHLLWHPNSIAPICGISILASIFLFKYTKKLHSKILLSISIAICYLALALTDSRAGILSLCISLFFVLFLVFNVLLVKNRNTAWRIILCIGFSLVCVFLFYSGTSLIRKGANLLITTTVASTLNIDNSIETGIQPKVDTTATEKPAIVNDQEESIITASTRGLSDFNTFNGRIDIWLGTIKGLKEHPDILVTGTTPLKSGEIIGPYFPANAPAGNFHNSYLGILVSFGIPGLAILMAFLIMLARASFRLSFNNLTDPKTLANRIIPAILLFTLAEGMMEVFLFVEWSLNYVWIWFLFSAAIVFRLARSKDIVI